MDQKIIKRFKKDSPSHWVGDGFAVQSIFNYHEFPQEISPFLVMDYAAPREFAPNTSKRRRGVGEHPHRGFETVTIVYHGEVEHRDSAGGGGVISEGDVQWMTAASGLVHEEFHGENFSRDGGLFEMIQLWVNLPKKDKMNKPRYQGIIKDQIPTVELGSAGTLRVIAGDYNNTQGPAMTHTPVNLWDLRLKAGTEVTLKLPSSHMNSFFVLSGEVEYVDGTRQKSAEYAVLADGTSEVTLKVHADAKILMMGGEPLNEPIFAYGPFVMNNKSEIYDAMLDFESGKMGRLS